MTHVLSQNVPKDFVKEIHSLGGQTFVVGGAVRDFHLGIESKDLDLLIRGVGINKLKDVLTKYGTVDEVGKSFGVLKWVVNGSSEAIDVALPRTEESTGDGHKDFKVTFDPKLPVIDDLARRDFTCNAIAFNLLTNKFYDPFDGLKDIKNKRLRAVKHVAFKEDPLRILRGIQFSSRFGFDFIYETKRSMLNNAFRLQYLSKDRIAVELGKLFSKGKDMKSFQILSEANIWDRIFTEIECPLSEMLTAPSNIDLRFAKLFLFGKSKYTDSRTKVEIASQTIESLKLTAAGLDKKKVLSLIYAGELMLANDKKPKPWESLEQTKLFVLKVLNGNIDWYLDLAAIMANHVKSENRTRLFESTRDIMEAKVANHPFTVKDLKVDGNDLQTIGIKGEAIGQMFEYLMARVFNDPSLNTKDTLMRLASSPKDWSWAFKEN